MLFLLIAASGNRSALAYESRIEAAGAKIPRRVCRHNTSVEFNVIHDNDRFGIHGVRAAMDGTDIRIRTPSLATATSYYTKDSIHRIKMHIVCDFELVRSIFHRAIVLISLCSGFIYEASVGNCGSAGDSTIWKD